jgi:tRNA uridine 5-carboxymethylaminomethyl modification enzyme
MFTSRAEFRLHLRIDNADRRLTPHGRRVGLINDSAWNDYLAKQERMKKMRELLEKTRINAEMLEAVSSFECQVSSGNSSDPEPRSWKLETILGMTLAQLLKRPEVQIEALAPVLMQLAPAFFERTAKVQVLGDRENRARPTEHEGLTPSSPPPCPGPRLPAEIRNELKSVETEIKYSGYLDQQTKAIERLKKSEQRLIPDWFDYGRVSGLSREMNEKLTRVRPRTLGQASRIPGVTPAAVSLINVYIEIQGRQNAGAVPQSS